MFRHEVDPIITALADKRYLANKTRSLVRFHRPGVEILHGSASPYLIDDAAYDALSRRSIVPEASRGLFEEVIRLALAELPSYEAIHERRIAQADAINFGGSVDQQG